MLGVLAAVLFLIAFLLHATSEPTSAVFSSVSLAYLGLLCLALHLTGLGPAWSWSGRRRRR